MAVRRCVCRIVFPMRFVLFRRSLSGGRLFEINDGGLPLALSVLNTFHFHGLWRTLSMLNLFLILLD